MIRKIYKFLSSVKLAIVLLVAILVCCAIGVTILRGDKAWEMIFSTLWFNSALVTLVVNVAFCFFPRIMSRKVTLVSFGMILFHLSFVAILGGVVYNSLFRFEGNIRLAEGETLPNGELQSYDMAYYGRFFDKSMLKGETTLIRMHRDHVIDRENKRAAYEIAVGEGNDKKHGIIYITKKLAYRGVNYFNDKEGYSVLVILYNGWGKELFGAYVPLQSLKQKDGTYFYTTGSKIEPGAFPFPQGRMDPLFALQVVYNPDPEKERAGEAYFRVWPFEDHDLKETFSNQAKYGTSSSLDRRDGMNGSPASIDRKFDSDNEDDSEGKPVAEGKVPVGEKFRVGDFFLSLGEVRYWVAMNVRYDPGKPIVLTSLWVGLGGMIITFFGRMMRRRNSK